MYALPFVYHVASCDPILLQGKAPLVVKGEACVGYFHSDGDSNDWGYKFKVSQCMQASLQYLSHIRVFRLSE